MSTKSPSSSEAWPTSSRDEPPKRPAVSDRQKDAKLLARAEADVVEAERRIDRQRVLVEQQREAGQPVIELERSLLRLEEATADSRVRRDEIRQRLEPSVATD